MGGFLPDTSVIVASVCAWHTHHTRVVKELESRLARREQISLAAPALLEAYSVLTRLPPPHRLSPQDAYALLVANYIDGGRVVSLGGAETKALLSDLARDGIGGGRSYDGVIAACGRKAGVEAVLTFNPSHFQPFAKEAFEVVVPGQSVSA